MFDIVKFRCRVHALYVVIVGTVQELERHIYVRLICYVRTSYPFIHFTCDDIYDPRNRIQADCSIHCML